MCRQRNGKSGARDNQYDLWGRKWTKWLVGTRSKSHHGSSRLQPVTVSLVYAYPRSGFTCSLSYRRARLARSHMSSSSGCWWLYNRERVLLICCWSYLLEMKCCRGRVKNEEVSVHWNFWLFVKTLMNFKDSKRGKKLRVFYTYIVRAGPPDLSVQSELKE